MADQRLKIYRLLAKYARHKRLSAKKMRILEEYRQRSGEHRRIADLLADRQWVSEQLRLMDRPSPKKEMWAGISSQLDFPPEEQSAGSFTIPKALAIAASVMLVVVAAWLLITRKAPQPAIQEQIAVQVLHPYEIQWRGNSGPSINIDTLAPGMTTPVSSGTRIRKTDSNSLSEVKDTSVGMDKGDPAKSTVVLGKGCSPTSLRLGDGSTIWLAGGSTLHYPDHRGLRDTFEIAGDAYFDIVKNPREPMILRMTDGNTVEVLGTSFYLHSGRDSVPRVALFSGSVRIVTEKVRILLRPNQEVLLVDGKPVVRTIAKTDSLLAWAREALSFDFSRRMTFPQQLKILADYYGCEMDNPENLMGTPIDGPLQKTLSVDDELESVQLMETGYLFVKRKGKVIHVSSKPIAE